MRLPINLSEMITMIRTELRDDGGELWSDEEIACHINRAVGDFSLESPLECEDDIATAEGSREVDVSGLGGLVGVGAIEYPAGNFPPLYRRFSLWGEKLTILDGEVPDGSDCRVYYGKLHTLDETECTVPARYHELIAAGAAGYAAVSRAIYSINRVNVGGRDIASVYLGWGRERLDFFRRETKRLGGKNRVRASRLYLPGRSRVSRTTDYGP